jgi:hypothetical protein
VHFVPDFTVRRFVHLLIVAGLAVTVLAACTSDHSGSSPTSGPAASAPSTSAATTIGNTNAARLTVARWGVTPDGLLSVLVTNAGPGTVRSARAIIEAKDKFGNTVAASSAPNGTRCCTIINLSPHQSFGLYSNIGTRVSRVADVSVQYAQVSTAVRPLPSPVAALRDATLVTSSRGATVSVQVTMSPTAGPYMTAQALLDGPSGKLIGVISGAYYCLRANAKRTITLQFFHPVPPGSSVSKVVAYPLDKQTALAEKAKTCTT